MTDDDHRDLAACLMSVKGMVILSGYHSKLYDELYSDWYREERMTRADGARPRKEMLWFNHAAHTALLAKFMKGGLFEGSAA